LTSDGDLRLDEGAQLNFGVASPALDLTPNLMFSGFFAKGYHLPYLQSLTANPSMFASPLTSQFLRHNLLPQLNTKQDAGHSRPQALNLPLLGVESKVPKH
jgi:hypothetical protein